MGQQEKLFGQMAVQKGFVTKDQIRKALEIQANEDLANEDPPKKDRAKKGPHKEDPVQSRHRRIGRILMDEGLISDVQVYQVLGTLHKKVGKSNI